MESSPRSPPDSTLPVMSRKVEVVAPLTSAIVPACWTTKTRLVSPSGAVT